MEKQNGCFVTTDDAAGLVQCLEYKKCRGKILTAYSNFQVGLEKGAFVPAGALGDSYAQEHFPVPRQRSYLF